MLKIFSRAQRLPTAQAHTLTHTLTDTHAHRHTTLFLASGRDFERRGVCGSRLPKPRFDQCFFRYPFLQAALINDHNPRGWKQREASPFPSPKPEAPSAGAVRPRLLPRLRIPPTPGSFWWLQVLCGLWPVAASLQSLPVPSCGLDLCLL